MSINRTTLRLWAEEEILKISHQINFGTVHPLTGTAKIETLESLIEDFNLHEVPDEEIIYHNNY